MVQVEYLRGSMPMATVEEYPGPSEDVEWDSPLIIDGQMHLESLELRG
jgi:hypothetical protein